MTLQEKLNVQETVVCVKRIRTILPRDTYEVFSVHDHTVWQTNL